MNDTNMHANPVRNLIIEFGKYRGRSVATLAKIDPAYLCWISTLPKVRNTPALWESVRGHLMLVFQAEINAERFADLA